MPPIRCSNCSRTAGGTSVGVFSGLLLLFSGLSLTRRMQRTYQQAWRLGPAPGVGHALNAGLGLAALLLGILLLYQARSPSRGSRSPGCSSWPSPRSRAS